MPPTRDTALNIPQEESETGHSVEIYFAPLLYKSKTSKAFSFTKCPLKTDALSVCTFET